MIERYTLPEMGALWSLQNKFQKWLDVEIAVCEVNEKQVLIPLTNDFIEEIDDERRIIRMSLPDGLIDLYLKG